MVPIGASQDSFHTLQYAVDFAAEFSAKIYVMEVFNFSVGAGKSLTNVEMKVAKSSKEHVMEVIEKGRFKKCEN